MSKYKIYGKITDQNDKALKGFKIELWDEDCLGSDDKISVTHTDTNGNYEFLYQGNWDIKIPGLKCFQPDIYITVSMKNIAGNWCQLKKSKTYTDCNFECSKEISLKLTIEKKQQKFIEFNVSKYAFKFANCFKIKDTDVSFVSDINMGLCGGMCAGALHRFIHGCPVPQETKTPNSGPLFDELFKRQVDTLSNGEFKKIWDWQSSPDISSLHLNYDIRHKQKKQWQILKKLIDSSKPTILCLIRTKGFFAKIWENHQVLAFGYEYEPTPGNLKIEIYDPNDKCGSNFLCLCLSENKLGAYQIDSKKKHLDFRGFFVLNTTDKASKDHY